MNRQALENLRSLVGVTGESFAGLDPVNPTMIRHWSEVIGGTNPGGQSSADDHPVVPPAMLRIWMMPGLDRSRSQDRMRGDVYRAADDAGFTSIVATGSEQAYLNPLRLGDTVISTPTFESMSEVKSTRLGTGVFITIRYDIANQDGMPVATYKQTVCKYCPSASSATISSSTAPAIPQASPFPAKAVGDVVTGDRIPDLVVPISRSLVVATAIISRDFQDIHHDHEAARRSGMSDIFTNIICTTGLVSRSVTDWAGQHARLEKISLRLHGPNYPGDTLILSGRVVSKIDLPDATRLGLEILGRNERTPHVAAQVEISAGARLHL